MLKQVTVFAIIFIACAMAQGQTSLLSKTIAQQLSSLINKTATDLKLTNSSIPLTTSNSRVAAVSSCGTDISCYVNEALIELLLDPLVYGLNAILSPVILLIRVLLVLIEFLLKIILGFVMGLLNSIFSTIPLGDLGPETIKLLTNIINLVNQLLPMVSQLLNDLGHIPSLSKTVNDK